MPGLQAEAVAALDRRLGPVQRERGGHQDRGVDARDGHRQVRARAPARVALGDADEEVGGEERPEDHHLGDDEKQHPQQRRVDARAAVGRRRAVVLVVVVAAPRARCWLPPSRPR